MSTRSGKRIHTSFHENIVTTDPELVPKTERKTRSRRLKENGEQFVTAIPKLKKRHNYVSYPADDEPTGDVVSLESVELKKTKRQLKRNTLKDHNITVSATETAESNDDQKKVVRLTRRTKKFAENAEDLPEESNRVPEVEILNGNEKKTKKNKKKKKSSILPNENELENGFVAPVAKKTKKKKKQKSNSVNAGERNNDLNKSGMSVDSFHSAAGSPMKETKKALEKEEIQVPIDTSLPNSQKLETFEKNVTAIEPIMNNTIDNESDKKRKSSIKDVQKLNGTFDKNASANKSPVLNNTFDKQANNKRDSTVIDTTLDKIENISLSKVQNSTFDKTESNTERLNSTFEIEATRKSSQVNEHKKDSTFEKSPKKMSQTVSLNSTFDKDPKKLDSTFDKSESNYKSGSQKSSLLSSDEGTINVTFDKSDNSRISITSDDSKENIVNTTPVLIESSIDESRISQTPKQSIEHAVNEMPKETMPPATPLKREGTFTKDGPDVIIMSPKPRVSSEKTPIKRMSLPSPGCTPFSTRSAMKSLLNVTRSIERTRRSSSVDVAPRQTKVMFCSPVNNNQSLVMQKRTVIKSSMKGSNKSFLFDDSVTTSTKPAGRKRSYTQNDADDTRVKRKRLADDIQLSVDRLSRPRTASATAKLDTTTPKKPATPYKSKPETKPKPRTKLPNFAALHQRQFDKMESLGECQERKAKRARQLLTPTAPVKPSPRVTTESKAKEPAKKPETPEPKLPTLGSLRPGYTRFGFKLSHEFNPFSIPSKVEIKPKEIKPNGIKPKVVKPVIKPKPLPSLAGATSVRREIAKNAVMREKSFTSLSGKRDEKRKENRTVIKGVRTNRRFDLQMASRNIN